MIKAGLHPPTTRQFRILFAEDDVIIGDIVTEMLQAEGFHVTTVESGDEGAISYDSQSFHLLLTDVRMPGTKDGLDLAAYARQKSPNLPVVIVSGYADELGTRLAALGRRVTFLRKPFRIKDLILAVESALLLTASSTLVFDFYKFSEANILTLY